MGGGGGRVVVIIDGGPLRRETPGDPCITGKHMPAWRHFLHPPGCWVMSPDFSLELTGFFLGKHLI